MFKKVYPNGFTLLVQPVEHVASVSCGMYLRKGSSSEEESEGGYFHFVEHMLFKGTQNRTSLQISESIERVGGIINALTSREYTAYYVSLIHTELPLAIEILADMVYNPLLRPSDIEIEKNVIIEEIRSYEDNPEDFLYDKYYFHLFENYPIGKPVAGTIENILQITEEKLKNFYCKHYKNENLILAVAGNCELQQVEELVGKFVIRNSADSKTNKKSKSSIRNSSQPIQKKFIKNSHHRKIEQVNFFLGAEGLKKSDMRNPALSLATNILGGGMSSRLFQTVREKYGYCYSIQSFHSGYHDTGVTSIYCATNPKNLLKAVEVILREIEILLNEGFKTQELEDSISSFIGGLAMGYETTEARMTNIAVQEIYFRRFYSLEERIQFFKDVTLEDLNTAFRHAFSLDAYHLSMIGNVTERKVKSVPHTLY